MSDCVFVTGSAGLLGRAVVKRLVPGRRVYAAVRHRPEQALPEGATVVEHDLRDDGDPQFSEVPETLIHLAQSPLYRDFPEGARDVFDVNVGSTQRLLDWGYRRGAKRFIFASTGSVYGNGEAAFSEHETLQASSSLGHYVASKRCGELLAEAYSAKLIVIILRFFTIYGPGQRATMLMPRLFHNVLRGQPITLQGRDGARFNPIYVDDAAAAVEAAAQLTASTTINVAGTQVLSLREIGTIIGEATKRTPHFENSASEAKHLIGDTKKMVTLLGSPKTSFAQGIAQIAADHATVG